MQKSIKWVQTKHIKRTGNETRIARPSGPKMARLPASSVVDDDRSGVPLVDYVVSTGIIRAASL